MDLPDILKTSVREGKAVLLLGAGASADAMDKDGNRPPTAKELGAILAIKFLGGKHQDDPLGQIGELAISETDHTTVQNYIRELFDPFQPSQAHRLMTTFVWGGLATTNYDRLIEKAYEGSDAIQSPKPLVENGDRIDDVMRDQRAVKLLKLHGCVTRTSNPDCPLILTPDQYIQYRQGRSRVFDQLTEWGYERPIVFVGHSLQDSDLRAIILELTQECGDRRPRYYAVAPHFSDIHQRLWEQKRITLIKATFGEFLESLDAETPIALRKLATVTSQITIPIAERFTRSDWVLSPSCQQFLEADVDYVKSASATEMVSPKDFYRGVNPGWSAVEQNLDVTRKLADTILVDNFLADEANHPSCAELILLKAHAGAGKSVLMRRIAWDAAHGYDKLCLFLRPHGIVNTGAIQELVELCTERVYLFVDDAAERARELRHLISNIGRAGSRLTVVIAERTNEWNIACGEIAHLVTSEYELKYLNQPEIGGLLELLDEHKVLGTLASLSIEQRRSAFAERAGRQLLVALHEATLGRPFEDIIEDEFANIVPAEAQRIYLSICVMNRFNVSVRAGVISRMHGVPFTDFKQRLFAPLEHVVHATYDQVIRDYVYQARHSHIAEIVFERMLRNPEERYDAYIRCLRTLNVDYADDRYAYRQMIRGRSLLDLFPNYDMVKGIYDVALSEIGEDAYLLHQMAIYEMRRPNGSLHDCGELLARAARLAPNDLSIRHSMAERYMKVSEVARTPLEKEQSLVKASEVAKSLKSERGEDPHGYHTLIKVGLSRLQDLLSSQDENDIHQDMANIIKDVEQHLTDALQRFPDESYILDAEAQFAAMTSDEPRILVALQKAFDVNPRSTYLATRLTQCHLAQENTADARTTLERALDANRNDKRLHYAYAKLLVDVGETDSNLLSYHLQRSFTSGDSNFDAQILYGRQLFASGDLAGSKSVFNELGKARVGPNLRNACLYPLAEQFSGGISRKEAAYCFVARDGTNDWIYAHVTDFDSEVWNSLVLGSRVYFQVGFSSQGARACHIHLD